MTISDPQYSQSSILEPVALTAGPVGHGSTQALMLAAIGVVFGDIGTSPLYALKECFSPEHGIPYSPDAVLCILSMLFWSVLLMPSQFLW